MEHPEIFFVAAEPSADIHSAMLAAELLRRGDYRLTGVGGPLMRQAGVELDFDSMSWASVGPRGVITRFPGTILSAARILRRLYLRRPAMLLLVDYGGLNMNLARYARIRFPWLRIFYYFPPRSWDQSERDRSGLARLADTVATPFPWSETLLRRDGVNAHFVGHPVIDRIQPIQAKGELRRQLGIPSAERYVGFMAGSRRFERALIGPQMLGCALALLQDGGYHFLWSPGPPGVRDRLQVPPELQPHVSIVRHSGNLLRASDLVVTSFGTATLEAAAALTPTIAVYRATTLDTMAYLIAKRFVRISHYTMPNIILGHEAVPELIRGACDAGPLAAAVRDMFAHPEKLARMSEALQQVRKQLGPPGSIGRTVDLIQQALAAKRGVA